MTGFHTLARTVHGEARSVGITCNCIIGHLVFDAGVD